MKLIGFNRSVRTYEEQPVKIKFTGARGEARHYTPDLLVHFHTNMLPAAWSRSLLIEVKYRSNLWKKWAELKPKFCAARCYAAERGWEFTIITDCEVMTPYLPNAIFLLEFLKMPIDSSRSELLLDALASQPVTTPEDLVETICADHIERAALLPSLWRLVANRVIESDLECPLTMKSRIRLAAERQEIENYERLRQHNGGHARRKRWQALRYYQHSES